MGADVEDGLYVAWRCWVWHEVIGCVYDLDVYSRHRVLLEDYPVISGNPNSSY